MTNNLCRHHHTRAAHPACFSEDTPLEYTPPAVLVLDIETLPILAYVWGAWEQDLNIDSIVKDWSVLAWSAKWLGDDKIVSDVLSGKEALARDDKRLVKNAWKMIDKADVIIGHNSKAFDIKKLNTRFMFNGLTPPSSYKHIDTFLAAKSVFGITLNKQDYIAKYLGIQQKLSTSFQLWIDCDNGKKKALKQMRAYNENDVLMLEEIYLRIRQWIPSHPNLATIAQVDACPVCLGSYHKSGIYYGPRNRYTEYVCDKCSTRFHGTKVVRA